MIQIENIVKNGWSSLKHTCQQWYDSGVVHRTENTRSLDGNYTPYVIMEQESNREWGQHDKRTALIICSLLWSAGIHNYFVALPIYLESNPYRYRTFKIWDPLRQSQFFGGPYPLACCDWYSAKGLEFKQLALIEALPSGIRVISPTKYSLEWRDKK